MMPDTLREVFGVIGWCALALGLGSIFLAYLIARARRARPTDDALLGQPVTATAMLVGGVIALGGVGFLAWTQI